MVGERRLGRCRQAREHTFGRCLAAPARRLVPSQVLSSVSTTSPPSRSWVTPPGAALAGQPLPPRARHHLAERTDVNPARLPSSAPTKPTRYRVGDARAEPRAVGRCVGGGDTGSCPPALRLAASGEAGPIERRLPASCPAVRPRRGCQRFRRIPAMVATRVSLWLRVANRVGRRVGGVALCDRRARRVRARAWVRSRGRVR
jgi:hypothetical protein